MVPILLLSTGAFTYVNIEPRINPELLAIALPPDSQESHSSRQIVIKMSAVQNPVEEAVVHPQPQRLSLLKGPTDPPLVDLTLGELLNLQCLHHGNREGIVIPWTGARWTYNELNHHSRLLAAALLEMGIGVGDRVGIMAGNCEQYAAVFFAATRIGAILVIMNNTYTPTEALYGLDFSGMSQL